MTQSEDLRRAAATGVKWTVLQTVGSRLGSLVVFVALARLLEPEAFGLVAFAMVAVSLLTLLVEQGFGAAVVQRSDLEDAHLNTAFWTSLGLGIALTAALVLSAAPAADAVGEPDLSPVLRWMAPAVLFGALGGVPQALLQRRLDFRSVAMRGLAATAFGGTVGVAAALAGAGVWSLVAQTLTSTGTAALVLWLRARWRPNGGVSRRHLRELFGFGVNVLGSNLLDFASRRSDDLLIGAVLGPVALGLYAVAYRVLLVMTEVMLRTINAVAFPVFSRVQADAARMSRGFLSATRVTLALAVPVFALVSLLAPDIVVNVFGDRWEESGPVMRVLSLIGILQATTFFTGAVFNALGEPGLNFRLKLLNATVNVAAFAVVVQWGILAVAIAYVARGYLLGPLYVVMAQRRLRFRWRDYGSLFVGPVAATLGMLLAVGAVRASAGGGADSLPLLLGLVALGIAVYGALLRLLSREAAEEVWKLASHARLSPGGPRGEGTGVEAAP